MSRIASFRDLIAWQKAMELADLVYDVTDAFPAREQFGLAHQLRKSAVSIPSNLAEGTRHQRRAYVHHLMIALGSHAELDTQCELATRRCYIGPDHHARREPLLEDVARLTRGLLRSLTATTCP